MGAEAMHPTAVEPRIAAEVDDLHQRAVGLEGEGNLLARRRFRRDLRETRQAEADLLRVLGYGNYDEFVNANGPAERRLTAPLAEIPANNVVDIDLTQEAHETEARLLRILGRGDEGEAAGRGMTSGVAANGVVVSGSVASGIGANENDSDAEKSRTIDELCIRVGALEEEVAGARFEILRLRDGAALRRAGGFDETVDARASELHEAVAALVTALTELRLCMELARAERVEAATLREVARVDSERRLDQAAAEARLVLDQARADAFTLIHDAIGTIEGFVRKDVPQAPETGN